MPTIAMQAAKPITKLKAKQFKIAKRRHKFKIAKDGN